MSNVSNIPKTMKALRLHEFGSDYRLDHDVSVPLDLGDYDVLIAIKSAGFCHTELLIRDGLARPTPKQLPLIPSHEPAGIIVAMGKKVSDEYKIGDRVGAINFYNACANCPDCLNDNNIYCENYDGTGISIDGAFAEYQKADSRWLVPLPDELSFQDAAPLMCAGLTAFSAIEKCALKKGQIIGIIGLGALGHLAVQFAKCMGLKVVAIDNRQEALDVVQKLKHTPDLIIDSSKINEENAIEQIKTLQSSTKDVYTGVDATIIMAEPVKAYTYALNITRKHGTMIAVGIPREPVPIHVVDIIIRNITIKGSLIGDVECARRMVKFVVDHGIQGEIKCYTLEEAADNLIKDFNRPDMKGKLVVNVSA
ncbi:unnamed protein product [Adineta steineri]|uniref:Enoyl reductase (ER) domain-containing protein n=3 Tax=Adineta steineri TaxID=433720 RepID=A0A814CHH9_9BILA|nr:unnamed protein product [Adineta steineri]